MNATLKEFFYADMTVNLARRVHIVNISVIVDTV